MHENEKQSTLEPFCQGVNELLVTGEKLVTSLDGKPDSLDGWKDLKARFSSFQMRGKDMQGRMFVDVESLTDIMPMVMRVTIALLLSIGFLA